MGTDKTTLISLKHDFSFKMFFGDARNKPLLLALLNAQNLFENKTIDDLEYPDGGVPIYDAEYENTHLKREFPDDKECILDVLVKLSDGSRVNLEMQVSDKLAFNNRVFYYGAKGYTLQIGSGDEYHLIKPFFSIVFVDFIMYPDVPDYYLDFFMYNPKHNIRLVDNFMIRIIEGKKLPPVSDDTDLLDWARFIFDDNEETKRKLAEKKNIFKEALDMVDTLSRNDRARMFYDAKIKQERDARAEKAFAVKEEREKWVTKLDEERRISAEKDTALATQAAEIAALKAQLRLQS